MDANMKGAKDIISEETGGEGDKDFPIAVWMPHDGTGARENRELSLLSWAELSSIPAWKKMKGVAECG